MPRGEIADACAYGSSQAGVKLRDEEQTTGRLIAGENGISYIHCS
jgi:hypothetical protein